MSGYTLKKPPNHRKEGQFIGTSSSRSPCKASHPWSNLHPPGQLISDAKRKINRYTVRPPPAEGREPAKPTFITDSRAHSPLQSSCIYQTKASLSPSILCYTLLLCPCSIGRRVGERGDPTPFKKQSVCVRGVVNKEVTTSKCGGGVPLYMSVVIKNDLTCFGSECVLANVLVCNSNSSACHWLLVGSKCILCVCVLSGGRV